MKLWILLSLSLLFLAKTEKLHALPAPRIANLVIKDDRQSFDLDFGFFEIRRVQAYLSPQWESVRLPASVSKNQKSRPEIDFVGERLEREVLKVLKRQSANAKKDLSKPPDIFIASLEPSPNKNSVRLANGEIWLDQELAIRLSLMESKFSGDPRYWWIAYPATYNSRTKKWDEILVIKDKGLKKKVLDAIRKAYLERYGGE